MSRERLTKKQKHILQQKLCDMKNRCYNPENRFYKDYGARGITVCDEWSDKKEGHNNFQKWALDNGWTEFLSLDRIDNDKGYSPENCRWATPKEQANNRRNNRYVTIKGVKKTAQQWADEIGISQRTFLCRIEAGWNEERLLEKKNVPLKMTKAEMTKEIKVWRNLEEQGLLLRVPCKINQDIYFVPSETNFKLNILNNMAENNRVYHQRICHIVYDGNGYYLECDKELEFGTGRVFIDSHYGEIWFLSQAEAEEKLRELEGSRMKKLWKFEWDGEYAFIGGLFSATDEEIQNLMGKEVYFGEYEGKYSEVSGIIEEDDIVLVSDNPIVVEAVGEFGLNPLEFLEESEE